jgi:hypothetical protein
VGERLDATEGEVVEVRVPEIDGVLGVEIVKRSAG